MNIVLIGYRGTGKTAVAKALANRLGWGVINLDELIIKKAGMSIPQIVKNYGWEHFRDLETEVTRDAATREGCVIDTGGGVILRQGNVDNLKKHGIIIWLKAQRSVIVDRIKEGDERPSLTGSKSFIEEIEEVLSRREPLYQKAADWTVDTSKQTINQVADQILEYLHL